MQTHALTQVQVRDLAPVLVDEPPVAAAKIAPLPHWSIFSLVCVAAPPSPPPDWRKRFAFSSTILESFAEAELDQRGLSGEADVSAHYRAVRLTVRITTHESDAKLARLQTLVDKYCPVNSFVSAAVSDYTVIGKRCHPLSDWLVVLLIIALASVSQTAVGFGAPLIAMPVLVPLLSIEVATLFHAGRIAAFYPHFAAFSPIV